MRLLLFSFFLLHSLFIFAATPYECVMGEFKSEVYDGGLLFGKFKTRLTIDKNKCLLLITKKRFITEKWIIDVCREPIHIKFEKWGRLNVLKRINMCSEQKKSTDYCDSYSDLISFIEDQGLIFAPGDRHDIKSAHGQIYCAYSLIKSYLNNGELFSTLPPVSSEVASPTIKEPDLNQK